MQRRIDLNGEWQLAWCDGQRGTNPVRALAGLPDLHFRLTAQVPGEVHLDLARAGVIADPATGVNALSARWVEEMVWFYRRTFDAPALRPGERAWLIFDRLELAARVWLNGEEVGGHSNALHPARIDVTEKLRAGENMLVVAVEAGLFYANQRPSEGYGMHLDHVMLRRNWLRTVQSSFAWDWAPRLLNVGISGDAVLEIADGARFDRLVVLASVSDDLQEGRVTARVFADGLAETPQEGMLTLDLTGLRDLSGLRMEIPITIRPGENRLETTLSVPDPDLWWPAGHGGQAMVRPGLPQVIQQDPRPPTRMRTRQLQHLRPHFRQVAAQDTARPPTHDRTQPSSAGALIAPPPLAHRPDRPTYGSRNGLVALTRPRPFGHGESFQIVGRVLATAHRAPSGVGCPLAPSMTRLPPRSNARYDFMRLC